MKASGAAPTSVVECRYAARYSGQDGRWQLDRGAYIDERATDKAFEALLKIFGGHARGTTGLFKLLVGNFLGAQRAAVEYETDGNVRHINVPKLIQGAVEPIPGARTWMSPSWSRTRNTGWGRTS